MDNETASASHMARAARCRDQGRSPSRWDWVILETLTAPDQSSTVLDGPDLRSFTRLRHSRVGRSGAAVRLLPSLVKQCTDTGVTQDKCSTLPDGRVVRVVGVPVLGPSGQVHAIAMWAGARVDTIPSVPIIGALEWNASGVLRSTPAAQYLLRLSYDDLPNVHTVPELMAGFDHWNDRAGFFNLFNLNTPGDRWTGTATKTYEDGIQRQLYIAARARGSGINRTVRAIVCDITGTHAPEVPDLRSNAVRHMPIPPGHAFGLVDLKTGFIHEWLADERSPLAGWRHHTPDFDQPGRLIVATTVFQLAAGVRRTADTTASLRFDSGDDWIQVHADWTRICDGIRPQALIDVTALSPIPPLAVRKCRMCQDISRLVTDREPPP